jgi:hypothetical protein
MTPDASFSHAALQRGAMITSHHIIKALAGECVRYIHSESATVKGQSRPKSSTDGSLNGGGPDARVASSPPLRLPVQIGRRRRPHIPITARGIAHLDDYRQGGYRS